MRTREDLQTFLEELIGSKNVYFQPPESYKMSYPAIKYSLSDVDNKFANNNVYIQDIRYMLTVMDYDPDSEIFHKLSKLPKCSFDRSYAKDNLNHFIFELYY